MKLNTNPTAESIKESGNDKFQNEFQSKDKNAYIVLHNNGLSVRGNMHVARIINSAIFISLMLQFPLN